ALRRTGPMLVVTPEAGEVHDPQLFPVHDGIGLLYSDARGQTQGIYARKLDLDGSVKSPARLLSAVDAGFCYGPTLARAEDGTFWVAYTQITDSKAKVHDLFVRHLDRDLVPLSEPVRLTAYASPKRNRTTASQAAIDAAHGRLDITYRLRRGSDAHI